MMRLALDASYGRAKFTDTGEEGPGNWVPPSPPIVHLGLLVPSSRESVSCRQSIRACSQVGEARGGGGAVGGVWCVCCRGAPKTDSQRAGKPQSCTQANRQSRKGEESPAAQLKRGPSKFSTPSPPVRVPMGHEAQAKKEEDKEDKQETNKKNPKKKTIN